MKKITATLNMMILSGSLVYGSVSADVNLPFNSANLYLAGLIDNLMESIQPAAFSVKKGPYDESDDPLLRRGTQNTDSPQGMFLFMPLLLTAIFFIVLFVRKKK